MSWAAVAGAAVSVIGSAAMQQGDSGGGGTTSGSGSGGGQTVTKDPWAPAAPWLQSNLAVGQNLQNQYAANPFSATQQRAYGQQFSNSDQMRQIMNAIMGQAGQRQPFNRGNPSSVPMPFRLPPPNASMENMGLGPTYGPASSIFSGIPRAIQSEVAPQPLTVPQIQDLTRQLISSDSSAWSSGDAGGE